ALAHLADAAIVFLLWAAVTGPYLEGLDARLAEVEAVCGQAAADELAALALLRALALWGAVWLAYFAGFTALSGRTPGKEAASLAVAAADGGRAPLAAVLFRESLGRVVSLAFVALGYLWAAWERQGRAWHDLIAGTRVVAVSAPVLAPSGPPAGFWRRAAALALDAVLVAVV
ncbi:MAG: RDD family protein, partial [Chloroflexi bacterium]|nr:RDD family protein [Chloroflexota bacterium]